MGLLTGEIANAIYDGFKGLLLSGVIRKVTVGASAALDENNDPQDTAPTLIPLEGFADEFSAFTKANAGIPDTDLKVNIFASSMPGTTPEKDDLVRLDDEDNNTSQWYQIRKVGTDPATALWVCQSFEVEEPA